MSAEGLACATPRVPRTGTAAAGDSMASWWLLRMSLPWTLPPRRQDFRVSGLDTSSIRSTNEDVVPNPLDVMDSQNCRLGHLLQVERRDRATEFDNPVGHPTFESAKGLIQTRSQQLLGIHPQLMIVLFNAGNGDLQSHRHGVDSTVEVSVDSRLHFSQLLAGTKAKVVPDGNSARKKIVSTKRNGLPKHCFKDEHS